MKPINFEGVNLIIGKNQPEYNPIPAIDLKDDRRTVITCWELSDEEIEELVKNKRIYMSHLTFGYKFQPILPSTKLEDII